MPEPSHKSLSGFSGDHFFRNHQKPGKCDFRMPDGTRCNRDFTGPPNKKRCDEHSKEVKLRGRA